MWFLLALALLAPVAWALLGAQPIPVVTPWAAEHAPAWLMTSTPVSLQLILGALVVGLVLGVGRVRLATTHLSTLAHEFGHGLVAALLGGRIERIALQADGSGLAYSSFPGNKPVRRFLVSFAGYLAPGVFGAACAQVALAGRGAAWVAYLVVLLGVMLVLTVRSWWGALVAAVSGALCWALLALGSGSVATIVVAALAGALVGGGVRDALGQWHARRAGPSDAQLMATQTRMPAGFFAGLQLAGAFSLAAWVFALPFL